MNEIYEANKKGKNVLSTGAGFTYKGRLYPRDLVEERVEQLQDFSASGSIPKFEGDVIRIVCEGLYSEEKSGVRYYTRKIKEEDIERVDLVYDFE